MSETQSLSQKNSQPIERLNSFPKEFTAKYDAKEGLFESSIHETCGS